MRYIYSARGLRACLRFICAVAFCAAAPSVSAGAEQDFERAGRAHRAGDFSTSVALWTALAEHGQVDAQYNLGLIHLQGDGVLRDYARARDWFQRAADQGDKHAQLQLGGMYQRGDGVPADPQQAHRWFTADRAHHHHHAHSDQMETWRRAARDLIWARDMQESVAAGPQAAATVAALRQRAGIAAQEPETGPASARLAASGH